VHWEKPIVIVFFSEWHPAKKSITSNRHAGHLAAFDSNADEKEKYILGIILKKKKQFTVFSRYSAQMRR
jgi:hypothetical protein